MLSLSVLCSSIFPLSLLVPFIYASAEDGCLQPWLRRNKLLFAGLHVLLVVGVVDVIAANLDYNQRWGGSSPLEETLLMAEDGVLLCKHELTLLPCFSQKGTSREGQG